MSRPPEVQPDDTALRKGAQPSFGEGKDQTGDKPESPSLTRFQRPESLTLEHTNRLQTARSSDDHNTMAREPLNPEVASSDHQNPIELKRSIKGYEAARQAQTLPLLMKEQHTTETKYPSSSNLMPQLSRPASVSATKPGESIDRSSPSKADTGSVDKLVPRSEKLNSTLLMKKLEGIKGKSSKSASKFKPEPKHVNQESRPKDLLTVGQTEGRTSSQELSSKSEEGSYFPETVATHHGAPESSTIGKNTPGIIPRSSTLHMPLKGSPLKTMISPLVSPPGQPEMIPSASNHVEGPIVQESSQELESHSNALKEPTEPTPGDTTISIAGGLYESLAQADIDQVISQSGLSTTSESKKEDPVPELLSTTGTQVAQDEIEAAAENAIETAAQDTAQESIAPNQIMTSADILAGRLPSLQNISDEAVPSETEETDTPAALTQAEKDFMEEEIQEENLDALVPAPKVITARDIRKRRYDYTDFPHTLKSAVPRVETHPGAITSATTGEIVPFADEQIHLDAGETLVDGTGRTWNKDGVVEPGKDLEGRFLVYEVDLNQVRKTYGSIPAILPWVSLSGENDNDDSLMHSRRNRKHMSQKPHLKRY
jgi:hypothetical protein